MRKIETRWTTRVGPNYNAREPHVALVVGSAEGWDKEYSYASAMLRALEMKWDVYAINATIPHFSGSLRAAVTLHVEEMAQWLMAREYNGYSRPKEVIGCQAFKGITRIIVEHWSGSSGLFATKAALEDGANKIVLCGVPMDAKVNHAYRGLPWKDANYYWSNDNGGWLPRIEVLRPFVRSMSGMTKEVFGAPTKEWLEKV